MKTSRVHTLSGLLLGAMLLIGGQGCSDDPVTPAVTLEMQPCTTSAECDGASAGFVCVGQLCRQCTSDRACVEDSAYGAGATCGADGACTSCAGDEGCACGPGGTCGAGLTCGEGGTCAPEDACEAGTDGCPCGAGDTCGAGLVCEGGTCAPEDACETGTEACACFGNDTCNAGLRCNAGACELCPPGSEGCACGDGDACDATLLCQSDVCAPDPCVAGTEGCPCQTDETCDDGLACTGDGMCAACTPEFAGCPCDQDGTCQMDLVCDDTDETCRGARVCSDLGCAANQLCDEAVGGVDASCLERCADGFVWSSATSSCEVGTPTPSCDANAAGSILADCTAQSRACVATATDASCGDCLAGFLEEAGACRAVVTCAALACGAANRECVGGAVADAACAGCLMGFADDGNGTCAPIPLANCGANTLGSILADCTSQHRSCVETADGASCGTCNYPYAEDANTMLCVPGTYCDELGCDALNRSCDGEPFATCGDCLAGTTEDSDNPGSCRTALTCAQVRPSCTAEQFCVQPVNGDATCSDWPCVDQNGDPLAGPTADDPNRPWVARRDNGMCVQCAISFCGETGETGRVYPFTLAGSNTCICETEPDYFFGTGDIQGANPCDADDDGWVRDAARAFVESSDPVLRDNARCEVRTIDRFTLRNEWHQSYDVLLCEDGFVPAALGTCSAPPSGAASPPTTLDLYETVRNDSQDDLDAAFDANNSGRYVDGDGRGRRPRAAELNPLTRLCLDQTGDFNHNRVDDVLESQNMDTSGLSPAEAIFAAFSYFAELHRARYEAPVPAVDPFGDPWPGRYVIEERSRCEADFPLGYNANLDPTDGWRTCQRGRDTGFNIDQPQINLDFAQYACEASVGGCTIPLPIAEASLSGEIPLHDVCSVSAPPDAAWRGMSHHSQFKCAVIDPVASTPPTVALGALADSTGNTLLQLNRCGIACPDDDLSCATDCGADGCAASSTPPDGAEANPDTMNLTCTAIPAEAADTNMVGFVAQRYDRTPTYTRGCIDEWSFYRTLCPGFDALTCFVDSNSDGVPDDFNADGYGDALSTSCNVAGQGDTGNFGALICGCGYNYGGPDCDFGCADAVTQVNNVELRTSNVHYGGTAPSSAGACENGYCTVTADPSTTTGRLGYWMCAEFTNTTYADPPDAQGAWSTGGGYTINGDLSPSGITGTRMCETPADCACTGPDCTFTGWTIRGVDRR